MTDESFELIGPTILLLLRNNMRKQSKDILQVWCFTYWFTYSNCTSVIKIRCRLLALLSSSLMWSLTFIARPHLLGVSVSSKTNIVWFTRLATADDICLASFPVGLRATSNGDPSARVVMTEINFMDYEHMLNIPCCWTHRGCVSFGNSNIKTYVTP